MRLSEHQLSHNITCIKKGKFCDKCNTCLCNNPIGDDRYRYRHCELCNKCVYRETVHCDKCGKHHNASDRYCDKCRLCTYCKTHHCDKCEKCVLNDFEHCDNCKKRGTAVPLNPLAVDDTIAHSLYIRTVFVFKKR